MSMNPLLQQFIQEARDFLQGIGEKLMALESAPDDIELMTELFRFVHTLKGNSGLFEFPDMTRVLHAGEDLMDAVRDHRVVYSLEMADTLLDAMDYVAIQIDEIEQTGGLSADNAEIALEQAKALRQLIPPVLLDDEGGDSTSSQYLAEKACEDMPLPPLPHIAESARIALWQAEAPDVPLYRVLYSPDAECFFMGDDPFHYARHTPGIGWGKAWHFGAWSPLPELDCYRCELVFDALVRAPREALVEYFRYTPEQIRIIDMPLISLAVPQGHPNGGPVYGDFIVDALELLDAGDIDGLLASVEVMLEISAPELWLCSALRWLGRVIKTDPNQTRAMRCLIESLQTMTAPQWQSSDWLDQNATHDVLAHRQGDADTLPPQACCQRVESASLCEEDRERIESVLAVQAEVLALPDHVGWLSGRLHAAANTLRAMLSYLGETSEALDEALAEALEDESCKPLARWLEAFRGHVSADFSPVAETEEALVEASAQGVAVAPNTSLVSLSIPVAAAGVEVAEPYPEPVVNARVQEDSRPERPADSKFGRRAEDVHVGKVLKVDQVKVDRLMNLIGEMVVAKNSLPYLASRAENQYGVRELSREIKTQYAVINRIAEEMQDAIMQVRMMPVSFVFQRFPRLVRDLSRKLGKEVELVLEGEDTEADKNIVEALADPLIHIVRNSLDHGLEAAEVRIAAGKPAAGKLTIRASQESDRVLIEVIDDGKGIDPVVIKCKAYEKGIIDESQLEKLSDQDAVNLVFAAGFSTADQVSDLSGRGVGMDVVRNAIDKVGGSVVLTSAVGQGTRLRLTLPLSMAVTNVMIIESDRQLFGIPMGMVVETVRLPHSAVRLIKHQKTTVLRGKIVPLVALNELLAIDVAPKVNADGELAVLVVRVGNEQVGLLVDEFREVVDVILKPLPGELAKLTCYAGTALLGDGTVLMVISPKELF